MLNKFIASLIAIFVCLPLLHGQTIDQKIEKVKNELYTFQQGDLHPTNIDLKVIEGKDGKILSLVITFNYFRKTDQAVEGLSLMAVTLYGRIIRNEKGFKKIHAAITAPTLKEEIANDFYIIGKNKLSYCCDKTSSPVIINIE